MQVTCPNCGARYAVDPMAIGPTGRTVQCARCSHRWREPPVPPETMADLPQPAPDVVRPPDYNPGLPALATPPATSHLGRWLGGVMVVLVLLIVGVYAFRNEILEAMPPELRAVLPLDATPGVSTR